MPGGEQEKGGSKVARSGFHIDDQPWVLIPLLAAFVMGFYWVIFVVIKSLIWG